MGSSKKHSSSKKHKKSVRELSPKVEQHSSTEEPEDDNDLDTASEIPSSSDVPHLETPKKKLTFDSPEDSESVDNSEFNTPVVGAKYGKESPSKAISNTPPVAFTGGPRSFRYTPNQPEVIFNDKDQLWLEDVMGPDMELCLCRVPHDIDLDVLNGMNIVTGGACITHSEESLEGVRHYWEVGFEQGSKGSEPTLLLPSKADQTLHPVQVTPHEMSVSRAPQLEPYLVPEFESKARVPMPEGLRLRHVPFGSDAPAVHIKRERRETAYEGHGSAKKKRKKEKR